jgi:hypothetical protein
MRACVWFGEENDTNEGDRPLTASGFGDFPEDPDGVVEAGEGEPDVAFIPALLRRRLSRAARGMLHCAHRVAPSDEGLRTVFASRHGEMHRTLAILKELHDGAPASPALFSLSVHNAVAGLWSIAHGSRGASSAVAAGPDTFGWGLMEACAASRAEPGQQVLYVYGDDRLPDMFQPYVTPEGGMHALALLLGRPGARRMRVSWDPDGRDDTPGISQSRHFIQALFGRGGGKPWTAQGGAWEWALEPW